MERILRLVRVKSSEETAGKESQEYCGDFAGETVGLSAECPSRDFFRGFSSWIPCGAFQEFSFRFAAGVLAMCAVWLSFSSIGCAGNREFGHPAFEPAEYQTQVNRAKRFDPYPDPNIGPPIPGARPHCYEHPSTERTNPTKLTY